MRVQRILASVLLSVFFWTPLAPALIAPPPVAAQHCDRKPLLRNQPMSAMPGMDCHQAAAHSHHAMAPAPATTPASDREFRSNSCCTSHDCCNSTVRSQWAQLLPMIFVTAANLIQTASTAAPIASEPSPRFDSNSGRAPPAL